MFRKFSPWFMFASFLALTLGQVPPQPIPGGNATTVAPVTHASNTTTSHTTSAPPTNITTSSTTPTSPTNATTTVVPPSTSTTPLPSATPGKWSVQDGNLTCILVDMAIQVDVTSESENKTIHSTFDVPANASSGGTCLNNTQELVLTWISGEKLNHNCTLQFQFERNESTKHFALSHIILKMLIEEEKNSSILVLQSNVSEFSTLISKSYLCNKEQQLKLTEDSNNTTVAILKISHVQLEAFAEKKKDASFSTAENCASTSSPDIVPIAVGCALVGLVAIVLIAYLLGRRRSQARGYLSM